MTFIESGGEFVCVCAVFDYLYIVLTGTPVLAVLLRNDLSNSHLLSVFMLCLLVCSMSNVSINGFFYCFLCSWDIFKSIEKYSRVSTGGYSGLKNVDAPVPGKSTNKDDHMDSFFMAETLKYLVRVVLYAGFCFRVLISLAVQFASECVLASTAVIDFE